ncbi:hypothetical protein GCM10028784_06390 [Myceligenerans cantabricum]
MSQLTSILQQFHDDLDRATDLLQLTRLYRGFAASSVPTEVQNGSVAWKESLELAQIAPQVRTDLPIMSGSILLYLCGRFENFVRETIVAIGDEHASKATTYKDLPEAIRTEIFDRTLEVAKSPSKYNFEKSETEQLIKILADSLHSSAGSTVVIESRLLAITESNMHSRMMAEVFKRIGIESLWRELGKQAPLKTYLGKAEDGQCTAAATSRLDAIMKERNGIAHPTSTTAFPDPDQVQETIEYFRVLSRVTVDLAMIPR